jgi:hypothetical protein
MGTMINLSDGGSVQLADEPETVVVSLAHALDREHSTAEQRGPLVPQGFALFQELDRGAVWVNATQIASIRST